MLRTFDATTANPQLRRITDLPGFAAVRDGLRQMIAEPSRQGDVTSLSARSVVPEDIAQELAAAATELDRELRRFNSSAALRGYLELPLAVYSGTNNATSPDLEEFELMVRRYDGVSRAPEYDAIAQLDSFRNTRRLLTQYVQWLQQQPAADPQPTPAEPLPLPEPIPQR